MTLSTQGTRLLMQTKTALAAGDAELADALLTRLADSGESPVEAIVLRAQMLIASGRAKDAIDALRMAREDSQSEPALWIASIDAAVALGENAAIASILDEAKASRQPKPLLDLLQQKATSKNKSGAAKLGRLPAKDFQAVAGLYQTRKFPEAERAAKGLLKTHSRVAPLWAVLGAAHAAQGKVGAAEKAYTNALKIDPDYAEARLQLGQLLLQTGRTEDALKQFHLADAIIPGAPLLQKQFGLAYVAKGRLPLAIQHLSEAARGLGFDPEVLAALVYATNSSNRTDLAKEAVDAAVKSHPDHPVVLLAQGQMLLEEGASTEAIECFKKAKAYPAFRARASQFHAEALERIGELSSAREVLTDLLASSPKDAGAFFRYTRLGRVSADDTLVAHAQSLFASGKNADQAQVRYGYGLAKAMEDRGEFDQAFRYLKKAKKIQQRTYPISASAPIDAAFSEIKKVWEMERPRLQGYSSEPSPIFVTGMPRSGTSLVEALLSSHSTVAAGGELEILYPALAREISIALPTQTPFDKTRIARLRTDVERAYRAHASGKKVITDKSILTFQMIGFVKQVFPDARIVVVRRDPRDNCLSMYKNNFIDGAYRYTYDLKALGEAYLGFERFVHFWRKACPNDFVEVRYEDLIAEPERKTRELVTQLGLPWENQLLEFNRAQRSVKTLSSAQVRQPIYSSSVGAWRNYQEHLSPLIDVLRAGGALADYET